VLNYLLEHGIPVLSPVKSNSGQMAIAIDAPEGLRYVTIFDFDCCGPGFRAYDLAVFLWNFKTPMIEVKKLKTGVRFWWSTQVRDHFLKLR
jgi:Ser/Thr protein kinase RdoA (MazF antagonist)